MVKDPIPGGRALARVAAKKVGVHRLNHGKLRNQLAAGGQRVAQRNQRGSQSPQQPGRDRNLLACADQFAPVASWPVNTKVCVSGTGKEANPRVPESVAWGGIVVVLKIVANCES